MSDKGGLGKGLSALLPQDRGPEGASLRSIPLDDVRPNPRQPRGTFDPTALEELAASIRSVGVLQPIIVRPVADGFELVAGERRLRAAREAGLTHVPAVVRDTGDDQMLRDALIENLQRVDLDPLEEAAAYRQLVDDLGSTHEEIATRVGKSRASITNSLRLLALAGDVQQKISTGAISAAHGRAIAALADHATQTRAASRVLAEGLSVRATEEMVRQMAGSGAALSARSSATRKASSTDRAPGILEAEMLLSDILSTRVQVAPGRARGRIVIDYADIEDLDRIVRAITGAQTT